MGMLRGEVHSSDYRTFDFSVFCREYGKILERYGYREKVGWKSKYIFLYKVIFYFGNCLLSIRDWISLL